MSSKPKAQRPTASEIALAQSAGQKDQRFEQAFRPLEQDAIRELSTANAGKRSEMIAGRQNADLEQAASQSGQQGMMADAAAGTFGSGATVERGFRLAGTVEQSKDGLKADADQAARDSIDQDTLNVIKTGQGLARQSQSSLTHSARLENSEAQNRLAASQMKDQARGQAIGSLLGAGLYAGKTAYDRAFAKETTGPLSGAYQTQSSDLNNFQSWMRKRWGSEETVV